MNFVFAKESSVQTADVSGITTDAYFEIQKSKDSQGHYLVKNVTADQPTAIVDIAVSHNANATSVVAIDGRTVRRFNNAVSTTEAISGLAPGIYIVNGKKVLVR